MVSSTHAFRFGYLGFRGTVPAFELKHRSGKPLFKALRCNRGIAFYANFGCLFAFGDATSTSYQYWGILDELNKERLAEDEFDGSALDAEVTKCSDHETDSENDVEDNPAQKEDGDTNSDRNVCIIHPFNF
ncbi:hypothetical protein AVEN_272175-1 [Araneus ventricosus]|uniref:Uncharacterized protein n=1 Tax=Araneus ventricosus TaxID=182803 RepID=A0A4Y2HV31_ARAVE|nr:hypothetical protein AVEN_272175-1 [Araneus ventricosus]